MSTELLSGLKDIESGDGDGIGDSSYLKRLLKWGNSPRVLLSWAIIGCICSFFCPMFLHSGEGRGVSNVGPIRLTIMLISCATAAALYWVGSSLRHHRFICRKPPMLGLMMGTVISSFIYIALVVTFISMEDGDWPTVVGLELLAVAVFVLLEMARPAEDFFILRFFVCLPVIVGLYHHGGDFVRYGWLTIVAAPFFLVWRVLFHEHHGVPAPF